MATPLKQSITFSSKELYLEAMAIINVTCCIFGTFPCGNGPDVLNTFITAGGSNGAPIGDMRSDSRPSGVGGATGGGGGKSGGTDDFTDVSGDLLGMLVHTM